MARMIARGAHARWRGFDEAKKIMSVTYYVVLPFVRTEDGSGAGKRRNVGAHRG